MQQAKSLTTVGGRDFPVKGNRWVIDLGIFKLRTILVDRLTAPQRCSHSNPQNLWLLPSWQKRICKCDRGWEPSDGESSLDYPGGPNVITYIFRSRDLFLAGVREEMLEVRAMLLYWLWKWRKGAMSQEFGQPLEAEKRQGNKLSPKASRMEHSPAYTLILDQWDTCQTSDL